MSDELDENDPFYASKKWGRDYRTSDEYWRWRHARDDKQRAADEAIQSEKKDSRESVPYFVKSSW